MATNFGHTLYTCQLLLAGLWLLTPFTRQFPAVCTCGNIIHPLCLHTPCIIHALHIFFQDISDTCVLYWMPGYPPALRHLPLHPLLWLRPSGTWSWLLFNSAVKTVLKKKLCSLQMIGILLNLIVYTWSLIPKGKQVSHSRKSLTMVIFRTLTGQLNCICSIVACHNYMHNDNLWSSVYLPPPPSSLRGYSPTVYKLYTKMCSAKRYDFYAVLVWNRVSIF